MNVAFPLPNYDNDVHFWIDSVVTDRGDVVDYVPVKQQLEVESSY